MSKNCPFCQSTETEKVSDFGTSLMVGSYYCRACRSHFESIKWGDRSQKLDIPEFLSRSDTETGGSV